MDHTLRVAYVMYLFLIAYLILTLILSKYLIDCSIGNLKGCNFPGWPLFVAILSAFAVRQVSMVVT